MRAASLDAMGLGEDNNCPSFLAGYSALLCLVSSITSLLLVASSSIWFKARQLILSKSPRYAKFDVQMIELLLGGGYYLWLWFFFEIHTAPVLEPSRMGTYKKYPYLEYQYSYLEYQYSYRGSHGSSPLVTCVTHMIPVTMNRSHVFLRGVI